MGVWNQHRIQETLSQRKQEGSKRQQYLSDWSLKGKSSIKKKKLSTCVCVGIGVDAEIQTQVLCKSSVQCMGVCTRGCVCVWGGECICPMHAENTNRPVKDIRCPLWSSTLFPKTRKVSHRTWVLQWFQLGCLSRKPLLPLPQTSQSPP